MAWCHGPFSSLWQRPKRVGDGVEERRKKTPRRGSKQRNHTNSNHHNGVVVSTLHPKTTKASSQRPPQLPSALLPPKPAPHRSSWRHEDWVDSQLQLNDMAERIQHYHDSSIEFVKVMETFHGPIDMAPLLRVLPKSNVTTLCLVGVPLEEHNSRLLARSLCDPRTMLQSLQLCRLSRWGVSAIAMALSFNTQLKELRLTFHHDLSLYHFSLLTHAIQQSTTLQVFKLYCANLSGPCTQYLAEMLAKNKSLKECRLTGCNIQELQTLALAIRESNTLERLDLSMNRIADTESMAILFDTPSLRFINLAENELGFLQPTPSHSSSLSSSLSNSSSISPSSSLPTPRSLLSTKEDVMTALAKNTTLEYLSLDMNPLSQEFVDIMHQSLQRNTTILRLCLLTISIPPGLLEQVEYLVALNRAGRGALRQGVPCQVMPQILSTVSAQPTLLYGMLTEVPHLWM